MLLPPTQNIVGTLQQSNKFSILLEALNATSLTSVLEGTGPFTLFAPTDAAFMKLGQSTITSLLQDVPALTNVLLYHVTPGFVGTGQLVSGTPIPTLASNGTEITVSRNGQLLLNGNVAFGSKKNIIATNGVVQTIRTVLIPPKM